MITARRLLAYGGRAPLSGGVAESVHGTQHLLALRGTPPRATSCASPPTAALRMRVYSATLRVRGAGPEWVEKLDQPGSTSGQR